jgi:hypothetical protein
VTWHGIFFCAAEHYNQLAGSRKLMVRITASIPGADPVVRPQMDCWSVKESQCLQDLQDWSEKGT